VGARDGSPGAKAYLTENACVFRYAQACPGQPCLLPLAAPERRPSGVGAGPPCRAIKQA